MTVLQQAAICFAAGCVGALAANLASHALFAAGVARAIIGEKP